MNDAGHPHTLSGRVDDTQLARVDAAARLTQQLRAHFVTAAALEKADEILRDAAAEAPAVLAEQGV